ALAFLYLTGFLPLVAMGSAWPALPTSRLNVPTEADLGALHAERRQFLRQPRSASRSLIAILAICSAGGWGFAKMTMAPPGRALRITLVRHPFCSTNAPQATVSPPSTTRIWPVM